jgi:hypothetical protein
MPRNKIIPDCNSDLREVPNAKTLHSAVGLLTRRATPRREAEIADSGAVGQETHCAKRGVRMRMPEAR